MRTRIQPSCLVRVRRASPWRKGKRKAGRPEAPMRPLRRCSTTCQPCLIPWGKTRKHLAFRCASPLPDFIHGAALAQLWGRHTPASHVPPPSPLPPISFTWFSTHLLPPLTQPSFHSSCAPHSKRGQQDARRLSHWPSADLRRGAHHVLGACDTADEEDPHPSATRYQVAAHQPNVTTPLCTLRDAGGRTTCSCLCSSFRSSSRPTPRSAPQYRAPPLLTEGLTEEGGPAACTTAGVGAGGAGG